MVDPLEPVGALSALGDPTRRSAYDYVSAQGGRVGRDEVATALGIGRTLAAYHLDRLAKEGLLSVAYARRSGRTGPGGDAPKRYERPTASWRLAFPRRLRPRARLLAHGAAQDEQGGTRSARATRRVVARDRRQGHPPRDLDRLLRERSYEPY